MPLGWRSANFVYASSVVPQLHLLLRNADLSTDISQRFSQKNWDRWPLTAETFADWCAKIGENAELVQSLYRADMRDTLQAAARKRNADRVFSV